MVVAMDVSEMMFLCGFHGAGQQTLVMIGYENADTNDGYNTTKPFISVFFTFLF
jgi:ABC-type ATPase involved in cell division